MPVGVSPALEYVDENRRTYTAELEWYLYFLKLRGTPDYPPGWIRVDQITTVKADRIVPDCGPAFFKVYVNINTLVAEVPTRNEADRLVREILKEVSMRLAALHGAGRTA